MQSGSRGHRGGKGDRRSREDGGEGRPSGDGGRSRDALPVSPAAAPIYQGRRPPPATLSRGERPPPPFFRAYREARGGVKMCSKAARIEKNPPPWPSPPSSARTRRLGVLKFRRFCHILSKRASLPGRRASSQVPEKFQQVPDLFQRIRDLFGPNPGASPLAISLTFFNVRGDFRGASERDFFPKNEGKTAGCAQTKVKTTRLFLKLRKSYVKKCIFL